MQLEQNVPLAPYTTLRIGGPARWFAQAVTEEEIAAADDFARRRGLPLFVLGGGSNLLVSDEGFPGLVLRIGLRGITREGRSSLCAAAGEEWDGFVARAVEDELAGVECLSGIPGSVGGTPVQNVGAYGQEVSQTIAAVRAFDREGLRFVDLAAAECGFSYRSSIFNTTHRGRYIVSRVTFSLREGGEPTVAYADLKEYFAAAAARPGLAEVRRAVREIRAKKGMLIVEGDPECRSAGSFFKNPTLPAAALDRIAGTLSLPLERIPRYPAGDGRVKLPAAWLLEQAGFHKGYALGKVGISSRHTLALVNREDAKASDMVALRDRVIGTVEAQFGFRLEPEPVWVG